MCYWMEINRFLRTVIARKVHIVRPDYGARGGTVVEALRYTPEGRGIDSRLCHWNFSLT
jgi:hypothetical protein